MLGNRKTTEFLGFALVASMIFTGGCTSLKLPGVGFPGMGPHSSESKYMEMGSAADARGLDETMDEKVYMNVRRAQAENSIVLQLSGDEEGGRVLPLPPENSGRSVFVSDLLKQTGVMKKIGTVDAVLYRSSPNSIGGIRMEVQMTEDRRSVRPESDYALQTGDRVYVTKAKGIGVEELLKSSLGL